MKFDYSNFTTNDPKCLIQSHQLAVSLTSDSQPDFFSIKEGVNGFSIQYNPN